MRLSGRTYDEVYGGFRWEVPERFNIALAICDRHVGDGRVALIHERQDGRVEPYTFERLREASCRLANAFAAQGIGVGDRIGILLPQGPEALLTHLAAYRLGAIALPLFTLFGPEALEYRLNDSGATLLVSNAAGIETVLGIRARLGHAITLVSTEDRRDGGVLSFAALVEGGAAEHEAVDTLAEDPALIIYTSGTTGNPKGALHAHRVLLGHLPGVEMPQEFFPQPGDRFWTPAD